jgi:hypothetical protein
LNFGGGVPILKKVLGGSTALEPAGALRGG